jgi:hypothetical protein
LGHDSGSLVIVTKATLVSLKPIICDYRRDYSYSLFQIEKYITWSHLYDGDT